jgi:hypothetical protein
MLVPRQSQRIAEVQLAKVVEDGETIGIVRGDATDRGTDGEADLDHLVEGRLVVHRTEGATVVVANVLQVCRRVEHSPATGAQHVPRHLEQTEFRGPDKRIEGRFLREVTLLRETNRVDAAERGVFRGIDRVLDRVDDRRFGRLPQRVEPLIVLCHGRCEQSTATGYDAVFPFPPRVTRLFDRVRYGLAREAIARGLVVVDDQHAERIANCLKSSIGDRCASPLDDGLEVDDHLARSRRGPDRAPPH